jgi:hypothetical protein
VNTITNPGLFKNASRFVMKVDTAGHTKITKKTAQHHSFNHESLHSELEGHALQFPVFQMARVARDQHLDTYGVDNKTWRWMFVKYNGL